MNQGIVYVLTNPAMPSMVKIGKTGREVETRLNDLYTTGVPLPFECAYAAKVADMDKVEKAFHDAFGPYRVNPKREFFDIEPEQAIALLELMSIEDMTPVIQEEAAKVDEEANKSSERFKKSRKPPLNFDELGIPLGSILSFTDGPEKCTVASSRKVEFDGKLWHMSALAQHLTGLQRALRGSAYFTYQDKKLSEIYDDYFSDIEE